MGTCGLAAGKSDFSKGASSDQLQKLKVLEFLLDPEEAHVGSLSIECALCHCLFLGFRHGSLR